MVNCGEGRMYSICKEHVLETLCQQHHVTPDESMVVGDGTIDISMLKKQESVLHIRHHHEFNSMLPVLPMIYAAYFPIFRGLKSWI